MMTDKELNSTITYETQNIGVATISNARQLGGYHIKGRKVRDNVLIRSGNLMKATPTDLKFLQEKYSLYQIIDFRSEREALAHPNPMVEGVKYINLPCLNNTVNSFKKEQIPSDDVDSLIALVKNRAIGRIGRRMYCAMVEDRETQKYFATFLDKISTAPDNCGSLWHCSQGKDRTGLASAFLLSALGAERDLIIKDYALSSVPYKSLVQKVQNKLMAENTGVEYTEVVNALLGVNVANFEEALDLIDLKYGSLRNYLTTNLDCDEHKMERMRKKYLE